MVWVNLLPWRRQQRSRALRHWLLLLSVPLVAGTLLAVLAARHWSDENQRWRIRIAQRQVAIAQADALSVRLMLAVREQQRLQDALQKRQRHQLRNRGWHQFAQELAQLMPETLWLTQIKKLPVGVSIIGFCRELTDVSKFRQRLTSLPLFQQVSNGVFERQPADNLRFTLLAREAADE